MMEMMARHAYVAAFIVAFLEFAGVPIPSAVLLLYLGAAIAASAPNLALAAGFAALGGMLADTIWFAVGRRHGRRLVRIYCTVSLGSRACTAETENFFQRFGLRALLFAKFVPGLCTFAAPMAGRSGVSLPRFLVWDGGGSLAWAATLILAGSLLGGQGITTLVTGAERAAPSLTWLIALMLAAGFGFKLWRRLRYGAAREEELSGPPAEPGTAEAA